MSIHLKISNSLKSLSQELAVQLRIRKNYPVFRPIYIVTQTEGMNSWLKMQIAEKMGIAANLKFLRPNQFINLVYKLLGGAFKNTLSEQAFDWLLFQALNDPDFIARHQQIASYYDAEQSDRDLKRIGLAKAIADLFDQYQIYRTDMIERWNAGQWSEEQPTAHEIWQADLWRKASAMVQPENFPDKSVMKKDLLNFLKDPQRISSLQKEIPVVYFFGLSLLTEYHNNMLYELSNIIEIQFLIQNPALRVYWLEDLPQKRIDYLVKIRKLPPKTESLSNPLLINWGKVIQDTYRLLYQDENLFNLAEEIGVLEPSTDTLLHQIQNSIFNNQKDELNFTAGLLSDGSLSISSCYSPLREIESLYNYLALLIDKKETHLTPRDIVVMTPEIDTYAPYIKAVFDNAPYRLPYSIADESYSVTDTLVNTLSTLLLLTEEDFTSEKVVSLLEFSALKNKFGIKDTAKIRVWVEAANIRFGFKNHPENDTDYVSWQYGLKRILFGLCMSGVEEYALPGERSFFPLDQIEGYDMFDAIRLMHFVESLETMIKQRKENRSLSDWVHYIETVTVRFLEEIVSDEEQIKNPLREQLERFLQLQEIFREKISYEVFLQSFLPVLTRVRRSGEFGRGNITFCSLIPMRSIPFKIVAVLGMDFDKFPRVDHPLGFDLMAIHRRLGDRSLKENDKNLFLETLLSAQEYLYISYVGQSAKDNTPRPPSALVDELLDFIKSNSDIPEQVRPLLVTHHPLHGFSKRYNTRENLKLYSYLSGTSPKSINTSIKQNPGFPPAAPVKNTVDDSVLDCPTICLNDLIRFLKHPIKGYFNQVLKVYFEEEENNLPEEEIFDLNRLQEWGIKNELLDLPEDELEAYRIKATKSGKLPLKNMANICLETAIKAVRPVQTTYEQFTQSKDSEPLPITVQVEDTLLTGEIDKVFQGNIVRYCFSKREEKYRLSAYLEFLAGLAMGKDLHLIFINREGTVSTLTNRLGTERTAKDELNTFLNLYKEGLKRPLPYGYDLFDTKKNSRDTPDEAGFNLAIQRYLKADDHHTPDIYIQKAAESGIFNVASCREDYQRIASILKDRTAF